MQHCATMTALPSQIAATRVRSALDALYFQFAAPTPAAIEGCPCCLSKRGVDALLITPLRELTGQALWSYVSGVFLTVGSQRDFRYLLPRILDIAVNDPGNSNDAEIVLGKLSLANWQLWSAGEREAIGNFLDAWFEYALARDLAEIVDCYHCWEAEGVLCGAARAGVPFAKWLVRLQEPTAAPVLADLKARFPEQLSAFWEDTPEGLRELSRIINS